MQLVVTGATGFIASRLIGQALSKGYQVTALARDPDRVASKSSRLQIEKWSIGDPLPAVMKADAILHLAAYIPADLTDAHQAAKCFEVNTNGALRVAMDAASQGVKRFVFFGSGQVYTPALVPASETSPAFPVDRASYYLASKLSAEICLLAFGTANALPVTVLRLASVYGPGMHGSGMVPTFIRALGSGRSVVIRDGGRYRVDLVFVDDVVSLALEAVEKEKAGVFNAGSGYGCTSLEAAQIVADILGADPNLVNVDGERGNGSTTGFATLNVAKAAEQLGYSPRAFREGIEAWKAETGLADSRNGSAQG
ncbi:NAD-dependent epimerase/dehydratase family protein [Sinorhizobium psoraleae]|uniref:NAD(P)-dependent oxidoreductase n=1 Tax=Sinorhizobium psoraleae TaxID=520838 RepID=A0ABT4KPS1_9HYPH|nr:NAD(P)-dependent oxidoreductase [Sinorhizobium psoraleae]MCZ4093981.1 NAD(P)-dependent oxidoreductase [Sinorhizobium psoraleae]